jgi:hypothetical protein
MKKNYQFKNKEKLMLKIIKRKLKKEFSQKVSMKI